MMEPNPFVVVPHEGQGEMLLADKLHPSEFRLEGWRNGRGMRAGVSGDEEQLAAQPLDAHVDDVVELGLLGLWLDVPGLEDGFDQFLGFLLYLSLEGWRHGG